jgi:hypothetical protein
MIFMRHGCAPGAWKAVPKIARSLDPSGSESGSGVGIAIAIGSCEGGSQIVIGAQLSMNDYDRDPDPDSDPR